jgi:hypothetical protein
MAAATYDPQANALGISFAPGPSEGEEVYPGVILHSGAADCHAQCTVAPWAKLTSSMRWRTSTPRRPACR